MAAFEDDLTYHPFGSRLLELRSPEMAGTDVKVLQTLYNQLIAITHPPQGPIGPRIVANGIFGPATRAAVINLQSYFGIAVDGVAGQNTYLACGQAVQGHTTYGGPPFGSRTLAPGASGGDVMVLQNRLNLFRYASTLGSAANGVFGSRTSAAVTAFRVDAEANGDTGLGPANSLGPSGLDAVWIYTYAGGRTLSQGRFGLDVAFLELLLANLTNPGTGRPFYTGAVDGYFGPVLGGALRTFQGSVNIAVDGVAGPQTYHQFGLHNALPAPRPAPVPPIS